MDVGVPPVNGAGICIPFKVPAVTPPLEEVIVLYEILNPIECLTKIPFTVPETFAYAENVPVVPKLEMVFPVDIDDPPMSIPVF